MNNDKLQEIKEYLENFEYNHSGKRNLNGGYAEVDIENIEEHELCYEVTAKVELGDCYDRPHKEVFSDCHYYLDKKSLRLLKDEEIEEMGIIIK